MVIRGYFFGGVLGCKISLLTGVSRFQQRFLCGFLLVLSAFQGCKAVVMRTVFGRENFPLF
jgi:hypothetical protein